VRCGLCADQDCGTCWSTELGGVGVPCVARDQLDANESTWAFLLVGRVGWEKSQARALESSTV
jgi:hypothetical protein